MARLEYFLVAESLAVDRFTNRISLFHVIEEIRSASFPIVIPQAVAVSHWIAEAGDEGVDFQARLHMTTPDGVESNFPQNFRLVDRAGRVIFGMSGVSIAREGVLRFELFLNGKSTATHEVLVRTPP